MSTKDELAELLPLNWVKRKSKSRPGLFYYFNTETGQSSWTPPSLTPQGSPEHVASSSHEIRTASKRCEPEVSVLSLGIKKTELFKKQFKDLPSSALQKPRKKILSPQASACALQMLKNGIGESPKSTETAKERSARASSLLPSVDSYSHISVEETEVMEWELTEATAVTAMQELRQQAKPSDMRMECDGDFSLFSLARNAHGAELNVIVDTNVFLANLHFVTCLLDSNLPEWGQPRVIIPWVVLQELDYLKTKKGNNGRLELAARQAGAFIHKSMTCRHPYLSIQTASEANEAQGLFYAEQADDKILQCGLTLLKQGRNVVLLSNDLNLCSKALAHSVNAYTWESLLEGIQSMTASLEPTSAASSARENTVKLADQEFIEQIRTSLRIFLTKLIEFEMEVAYDKLWRSIVLIKPPWTLTDTFRCVNKHWIAVFGMLYPSKFRDNVNALELSLQNCGNSLASLKDGKELFDIAHCTLKTAAQIRKEFVELVENQLRNIKVLLHYCHSNYFKRFYQIAFDKWEGAKRNTSIYVSENKQKALDFFQVLWHQIFLTCAEILHTLKLPNNLECYPVGSLTAIQAHNYLINLQNALLILHKSMSRFLVNADQGSAREFAQSLFACVNTNVIIMNESTLPVQSVKELTHALLALASDEEGRAKMENGLGQLKGFHDILPDLSSTC